MFQNLAILYVHNGYVLNFKIQISDEVSLQSKGSYKISNLPNDLRRFDIGH